MSLQMDARQRAMLAEMGVRLFLPAQRAAQVAPEPEAAIQPQRARAADVPAPVARPPARPVPIAVEARPTGIGTMTWDVLAETVSGCRACKLCQSRRNTVFGVGDTRPDWLVIGEAPGENEDLQGEPFVGQAGKLLDNMLRPLGVSRKHKVYIANVLKCRPPGNRNPEPEEVAQCEPFLRRQVELLQPRIILAMGRFAVQSLLQTTEPIGRLRGRAHQYNGVPVVVTYHPAYLLRNLPDKAKAWADLCLALSIMRESEAA
jgi:DNA polymerase